VHAFGEHLAGYASEKGEHANVAGFNAGDGGKNQDDKNQSGGARSRQAGNYFGPVIDYP
jgi:hypothetical protein